MKKVYVINGTAGVGKDTFIELCRQLLQDQAINVATYSSVDEVKQYLRDYEGWDGVTKDAYWRIRMYETKKRMIEEEDDRPKRYLLHMAEVAPDNSLIFFHIRELTEIQKILMEYPDAKTIEVVRPSAEIIITPVDAERIQFEYDITIINDGTLDDLTEAAKYFLLEQLKEFLGEGEQLSFGDVK